MSSLKDPHKNVFELGFEQIGFDWTAAAKLGWQGTWLLNGSYTQEITRNLTLGTDLMWFSVNGASVGSLAFRYTPGQDIFFGQYTRSPDFKSGPASKGSVNQTKLCYARKVSDRLTLGSELEFQPE